MIELRNTKVTQIGENKFAIVGFLSAIQMKEGNGWEDIDPTLDSNGQPNRVPYVLTPHLTGMPGFHYKSKQSGEFDVRLKSAVSISLPGRETILPVIPVPRIEGSEIVWSNIYPDTDIVLVYHNAGVTLKRVLKSSRAPLEYDVNIDILEEGIAGLLPLYPALDAMGQSLVMEEVKIDRGRSEILKLEGVPGAIELRPITYPIQDATVISEQVDADSDDSTERPSDGDQIGWGQGAVDLISSAVEATRRWGGFRWPGVAIPKGSTIGIAYVELFCTNTSNDDINHDLYFQLAASPVTFADVAFNITGRGKTTAFTPWIENNIGTLVWAESPSLVNPLQEVVNAFTTTALVLICEPNTDSTKYFSTRMHEIAGGANAAKLYVEYTPAPPEVEPKHTFRLHPRPGHRMEFHPNLKLG